MVLTLSALVSHQSFMEAERKKAFAVRNKLGYVHVLKAECEKRHMPPKTIKSLEMLFVKDSFSVGSVVDLLLSKGLSGYAHLY
jgi:hypothetical protein